MKRTLQVLNELERDGVFVRYAIGGAMAATFYAEPFLTFDLDIFIALPPSSGQLLTLTPIYEALRRRGYHEDRETVRIEGVPVQFLPAYNELLEEALREASDVIYDEDTPTHVLRSEHLVAICLQTGREKDRDRVRLLSAQAKLDQELLDDLLRRYHLTEKWETWKT